jgi:hypothetical protein
VPSLAAVAALLELSGAGGLDLNRQRATGAAFRGLTFLTEDVSRFDPATLPDFVAIELIVPALLADIARALAADGTPRTYVVNLPKATRAGFRLGIERAQRIQESNGLKLMAVRRAAERGDPLPEGLVFSFEVLDQPPKGWHPEGHFVDGQLATSPALTATALSWCRTPPPEAISYLTREGARRGGAWPNAAPAVAYERAWVVGALSRFGIPLSPGNSRQLAASLHASLGPNGAPFARGLPPDGDDTGAVMFALYELDEYHDPACLLTFEADTCFVSYHGERNASITTNAHILDALAAVLDWNPPHAERYRAAATKAANYLLATQNPDGYWTDKWHASPYYATACVTLALARFMGPHLPAVARAIQWLTTTQRPDGSWGRWSGTLHETACALHVLLSAEPRYAVPGGDKLVRGARFLTDGLDAKPGDATRPPLWHCKDVYYADKVERALVLSALYRFARSSEVVRSRPAQLLDGFSTAA